MTGFRLFNREVSAGAADSPLARPIHLTERLELGHRDDVATVEFAGLDCRAGVGQRFRYRLEGFDRGWLETDSRQPSATYTDLDPGSYTFRVESAAGDGSWGPQGASLALVVKPPSRTGRSSGP